MENQEWSQRQQERWARQQERWARRQERWKYKQARWARRQEHWNRRSPAHGVVMSVAIIALGALFLLDNLGVVRFDEVARYWPVILIALGVVRLVEAHGTASIVFGSLLAGIGGLLLLDNLGIIYFGWRLLWPAILIALGILMLFRNLEWQQRWESGNPNSGGNPPPAPGKLNLFTMFGGGERRIDAQDFRGGEIGAMFGGYEIDLRGAAMADGQATIDLNVMFGGAEIQVPETWAVDARGHALFGGFSDETRHPDPAGNPPRLTVTGYAMFGGVTITN